MSADYLELERKYPNCIVAIAFTELFMDTKESGVSCLDEIRKQIPPLHLSDVIQLIRIAVDTVREEGTWPGARWEQVLKELEHPEFLLYLKARLGLM